MGVAREKKTKSELLPREKPIINRRMIGDAGVAERKKEKSEREDAYAPAHPRPICI